MKPGDLVKATGPAAPAIGLVLRTLGGGIIELMWIDDKSIDSCSQMLLEVINEAG